MAEANGPRGLTIRECRPDDVKSIVDIAIAAWEPVHALRRELLGEELAAILEPGWQERKANEVRSACSPESNARVLVAEEGGEVVGFVTFYTNSTTLIGEIGNNAVRPDRQGRGIGTMMYMHAFERLREAGMRFVKVTTRGDEGHAAARRAYEKAGFNIRIPLVTYYRKL